MRSRRRCQAWRSLRLDARRRVIDDWSRPGGRLFQNSLRLRRREPFDVPIGKRHVHSVVDVPVKYNEWVGRAILMIAQWLV
jgi:hypothetical protein